MAVHAKLVYALPPVPNILARSETLLFLLYVRYKNREKILSERSNFILVFTTLFLFNPCNFRIICTLTPRIALFVHNYKYLLIISLLC